MEVFSGEDYCVRFNREDGTEFDARYIALFTTKNPKFERNYYCALYSPEFNPNTDEPIVLFRVETDSNNQHKFFRITDLEEAQAMYESWDILIKTVQNKQVKGTNEQQT